MANEMQRQCRCEKTSCGCAKTTAERCTCGEERDLSAAIEAVREHFTPDRVQMMHIVRGILVD